MDGSVSAPSRTLATLAGAVARLETEIEGWDADRRDVARDYRLAIDALHAEALRRLVRALRAAPETRAALREAAGDEVVYAVLRHHGIVKPSLAERIETALDHVRPVLANHGGDVELVGVEPPQVTIRLLGACDNCPASRLTIDAAVKTAMQAACPEITEIVQVRA
jgi:Fe-S cluster biogenesis protein NfuA